MFKPTYHLKTLILLAVLLMTAVPVAAAPGSVKTLPTSNTSAAEYAPDSEECAFLGIINAHRGSIGRGPLTLSRTLGAAADHHSLDMAANGNFNASHQLSDGTDVPTNIKNHGYPLVSSGSKPGVTTAWWGENIFAGSPSAQVAFDKWYASSGHRTNMERPEFNAIGVGRASSTTQNHPWYWTTTFGGLSLASDTVNCVGSPVSTPTPAPTTPPATRVRHTIVTGGRTSNSTTSLVAFDNDSSTYWKTVATSPPSFAYVWVDLGAVKSIGQIKFMFAKLCCADKYYIQVSNDRVTWTTISTRTGPSATSAWIYKNWTGSARYVRFYFENPDRHTNIGYLSEVAIYSP